MLRAALLHLDAKMLGDVGFEAQVTEPQRAARVGDHPLKSRFHLFGIGGDPLPGLGEGLHAAP